MEHHIKLTVVTKDDTIDSTKAVIDQLNNWMPYYVFNGPTGERVQITLRAVDVMPNEHERIEAHFRSLSDVVKVALHTIDVNLRRRDCNMVDVQKLLEWMRAVNSLSRCVGLNINAATDTFDAVSSSLMTIAAMKGNV